MKFNIHAPYSPSGDQVQSIKKLSENINKKVPNQVLMGATGTGKTFTIAKVIEKVNKKTLVMAHNKTLAMQLYTELKALFPDNKVEYFVSSFDFYQPEAYVAAKDLYIDKDAKQNSELYAMRLSAMSSLVTREDTIVVASVAAIYGAQDPEEFKKIFFNLKKGQNISRQDLLSYLVQSGYVRNDIQIKPGTFSALGDVIKITFPQMDDEYIRLDLFGNEIEEIAYIDLMNHNVKKRISQLTILPAQDYITSKEKLKESIKRIESELAARIKYFIDNNKLLEAQRIKERTLNDLEDLKEFGICSGIENYSRHLDLREAGETPFTLIDYFGEDYLMVIDESHMTLPQVKAMFNTDRSRKENLVNFGFRLPSAIDNRPLNFEEFIAKQIQVIYTSATPGDYESNLVEHKFIEQIIRPTGLLDPTIEVKNKAGQVDDIIEQINKRKLKNQRTIITTLTIRMSEDLTSYLQDKGVKVAYLHSELKTLERTIILNDFRRGLYDCVVGVNLLREGIDCPEVSLICILDADKQGFLRNTRSLIQTIGRAARNSEGHVILYADQISAAMKAAIDETDRRREIQEKYNMKYNIVPTTIIKKINNDLNLDLAALQKIAKTKLSKSNELLEINIIEDLEKQMKIASNELNFEEAAKIRDIILELKTKN